MACHLHARRQRRQPMLGHRIGSDHPGKHRQRQRRQAVLRDGRMIGQHLGKPGNRAKGDQRQDAFAPQRERGRGNGNRDRMWGRSRGHGSDEFFVRCLAAYAPVANP